MRYTLSILEKYTLKALLCKTFFKRRFFAICSHKLHWRMWRVPTPGGGQVAHIKMCTVDKMCFSFSLFKCITQVDFFLHCEVLKRGAGMMKMINELE